MNHHGPSDVPGVVKHLAGRAMNGRALALVTSHGPPGSGKTKGSLLLGDAVQRKMGAGPLQPNDLMTQLRFKPKDFPTMAQAAPGRKAVYCDEGSGEGANKMRQMGASNVEVAIDLDACRVRCQPVFWNNPHRQDVAAPVLKHTTWAVEYTLDHAATFWEAEAVDAMFGKVPFLHERFCVDPFPYLGDYLRETEIYYDHLKDLHGKGIDPFTTVAPLQVERRQQYRAAIARVLG